MALSSQKPGVVYFSRGFHNKSHGKMVSAVLDDLPGVDGTNCYTFRFTFIEG